MIWYGLYIKGHLRATQAFHRNWLKKYGEPIGFHFKNVHYCADKKDIKVSKVKISEVF